MSLSPYLSVPDARAAIAFYVEAFGAVPQSWKHIPWSSSHSASALCHPRYTADQHLAP